MANLYADYVRQLELEKLQALMNQYSAKPDALYVEPYIAQALNDMTHPKRKRRGFSSYEIVEEIVTKQYTNVSTGRISTKVGA